MSSLFSLEEIMKIIKSLEEAKTKLQPQVLGMPAMSDILFELFIRDTRNNYLETEIVVIDDKEKFEKPNEEPLMETVIGRCRKEIYEELGEDTLTIIYTILDRSANNYFDSLLDLVSHFAERENYNSISKIQRDWCCSYPDALKIHTILKEKGLIKDKEE